MAAEKSVKRIVGVDRSGGPNRLTTSDQPWRPWTIPNAIGYFRAAMIPIFLALAWNSPDGRDTAANIAMFICGVGDYFDGLAARLTGQYSRLGALLDPLIDRLLILASAIIIFKFELLPRYLIGLVALREFLMLALALPLMRRGFELRVNWLGRLSVWPLMAGGFLTLCIDSWVAEGLVWIGMIGSYAASWLYFKAALPVLRGEEEQAPVRDLNHS